MTDPVPPDAGHAEALARAVGAVPGVVRLHGGPFGEVAAYLPGRRVVGVRRGPDAWEVHVVLDAAADLRSVAALVHDVARVVVGSPVHVHVDDVVAVPALPTT